MASYSALSAALNNASKSIARHEEAARLLGAADAARAAFGGTLRRAAREREVAAEGLTNPQIGERLFITRGTVKVHVSHIFAKLGIASRAELAAEAVRRERIGER